VGGKVSRRTASGSLRSLWEELTDGHGRMSGRHQKEAGRRLVLIQERDDSCPATTRVL
jgi:hypothetical protein